MSYESDSLDIKAKRGNEDQYIKFNIKKNEPAIKNKTDGRMYKPSRHSLWIFTKYLWDLHRRFFEPSTADMSITRRIYRPTCF